MSSHKCWCGRTILTRLELPPRRGGENFEFTCGATRFTASIRRAGGSRSAVREVFVNGPKVDSDVDLTIRDAAILISVALQYGIPVKELAHAMGRNRDNKASSPIGEILDILLAEELA